MQTKKIKKNIFKALLAVLCMSAYMNVGAQQSWMTQHGPARSLVYQEKLEREIGFLTDTICNGRGTGTSGAMEAGAWISRKFSNAGLLPFGTGWSHSFTAPNGTTGRNIIGFLPGSSKRHPDRYIIIGAHYDHLGNIDGRMFPGADANASGTVAMTSLADMMAATRSIGRSYLRNVIFVGFDGKEMDMSGSEAIRDMIKSKKLIDPVTGKAITRDRITLMINIDQIGSSLSPLNRDRDDYMIMLDGSRSMNYNKSTLKSANSKYDIGLDLGFSYYGSDNFTRLFYNLSDQKAFADIWIPSVMLTSGITMNNNKTWDDLSSLDMEVYIKRIYLIYHWLLMMI